MLLKTTSRAPITWRIIEAEVPALPAGAQRVLDRVFWSSRPAEPRVARVVPLRPVHAASPHNDVALERD